MLRKSWDWLGPRLLFLVAVFAIPIGTEHITAKIRPHYEARLLSDFHQVFPHEISNAIKADPSQLCHGSAVTGNLHEACEALRDIDLLSKWSSVSYNLAVGLMTLFFVSSFYGIWSQYSRPVLLMIFLPSLYVTVAILIFWTVLNAALVLGIVTYAAPSGFQGILAYPVFAGALVGIVLMISASLKALRKAVKKVDGRAVSAEQQPILWKLIDEMANAVSVAPPKHLILGLDLNFFVTEANVECMGRKLSGRTMFISLPLCRILSQLEMKSILYHEFAHYKGEDTKYSCRFYPVYRGAYDSIQALTDKRRAFLFRLIVLPTAQLMTSFLNCFSVVESKISRSRESAADKFAAEHSNTGVFATALTKIHYAAPFRKAVFVEMIKAMSKDIKVENESAQLASMISKDCRPEALMDISNARQAHPTDRHPPLHERLEGVGTSLAACANDAQQMIPLESASKLIVDPESLEKELTEVDREILLDEVRKRFKKSRGKK